MSFASARSARQHDTYDKGWQKKCDTKSTTMQTHTFTNADTIWNIKYNIPILYRKWDIHRKVLRQLTSLFFDGENVTPYPGSWQAWLDRGVDAFDLRP